LLKNECSSAPRMGPDFSNHVRANITMPALMNDTDGQKMPGKKMDFEVIFSLLFLVGFDIIS